MLVFLVSIVRDCGTVVFQLSGFYCKAWGVDVKQT